MGFAAVAPPALEGERKESFIIYNYNYKVTPSKASRRLESKNFDAEMSSLYLFVVSFNAKLSPSARQDSVQRSQLDGSIRVGGERLTSDEIRQTKCHTSVRSQISFKSEGFYQEVKL